MDQRNYNLNQEEHIGGWDERGLLNSFKKKGVTHFSAISEYLGNSIDAGAENICFILVGSENGEEFLYVDDGVGMTRDKAKDMFNNYKSNHANDQSIGCVGIGAKLANAFISKYRYKSYILTKSKKGDFLKLTIPWDDIFQSGVYNGQIKITNMNDDEKKKFVDNIKLITTNDKGNNNILDDTNKITLENYDDLSGCLIIHKTNTNIDPDLYDTIKTQFSIKKNLEENQTTEIEPNKKKYHKKAERWDCMFEATNLKIMFIDNINPPNYTRLILDRYIHKEQRIKYYKYDDVDNGGLTKYTIQILQNKNNSECVFVVYVKDKHYTLPRSKRGYASIAKEFNPYDYQDFENTGDEIIYHIGVERNNSYFDPDNPSSLNWSSSKASNRPYDGKWFDLTIKEQQKDCSLTSVLRNGQQVTCIEIPGFEFSKQDGGRGCEKQTFEIKAVKDVIEYYTISGQNNTLDDFFGIQEIKNKIDPKKIRKDLLRLIHHIRKIYCDDMFSWWTKLVNDYNDRRDAMAITLQCWVRRFVKRIRNNTFELVVQNRLVDDRIRDIPQNEIRDTIVDNIPQNEISYTIVDNTPQNEIRDTTLDNTPQNEISDTIVDNTPQNEISDTIVDNTPQNEIRDTIVDNTPQNEIDDTEQINFVGNTNKNVDLDLDYTSQNEDKEEGIENIELDKKLKLIAKFWKEKTFDEIKKKMNDIQLINVLYNTVTQ